jgi:hypothetical protein
MLYFPFAFQIRGSELLLIVVEVNKTVSITHDVDLFLLLILNMMTADDR